MSGCIIATWTENGQRMVGHNGTVDAAGPSNERVKKEFRDKMPRDVQGFSPASAWSLGEIAALNARFKTGKSERIVALVTSTGQFHSMVLFNMRNALEWCVGGIKPVPAMSYAALRTKLGGTVIGMRG